MREIKFRTFVKNEGVMIYGQRAMAVKQFTFNYAYLDSEVEVMQYVNLKDKNGDEIFEGDIIKGHYLTNQKDCRIIGEVVYTGIGFKLKGINQYKGIQVEFDNSFEVIGNIYENPELFNA